MIKKLIKLIKIFFLFIIFLYAFVPFETVSGVSLSSPKIHVLMLMIITIYALQKVSFKIRMNMLGKISLIFLFLLIAISGVISYGQPMYFFSFSLFLTSLIASAIYYNFEFQQDFLKVLKWIIIFSIFMFFLQLIIFTMTGDIIDFHKMVFPMSEGRSAISNAFIEMVRLGGIFIEPGTYSNSIYFFLLLFIIISRNIMSPLVVIGAISMILSSSLWGITFGIYLLIILILLKFKLLPLKKKIALFFTMVFVMYFTMGNLINSNTVKYSMLKLNSNTASVEAKELAYDKYTDTFGNFLVIGEGFAPTFNEGIDSVQDAGFLLNLSVGLGIVPTFLILLIFILSFLKCCTRIELMIALPIFFSKIYYWDAIFWLLFFLIIYGTSSSNKKVKHIRRQVQ